MRVLFTSRFRASVRVPALVHCQSLRSTHLSNRIASGRASGLDPPYRIRSSKAHQVELRSQLKFQAEALPRLHLLTRKAATTRQSFSAASAHPTRHRSPLFCVPFRRLGARNFPTKPNFISSYKVEPIREPSNFCKSSVLARSCGSTITKATHVQWRTLRPQHTHWHLARAGIESCST